MLGLVRKSELDACNKVRLKVEAALLESESENSRLTDVIRRQSDEVDHLRSKLQELKGHPCFTSYRDLELINQEVEKQKAWMQERVLKYQSSLEDLNDEIAACKDELAEKRTSLEFFDEMEDVSGLVKKLYGPGADATKKKIEAVHEDLKAYIRSERAWSFSGKLTFDESTTKGRAVQKRTAKFMLAAFNAEASHLIAKSTASNFTQTIRKIENWFDRVNKFGKDDMCILERDLLTLRLEEHRLTFEHLMRAEFEKDEQRHLREVLREEKAVEREMQNFIESREKEESQFEREIAEATEAARVASTSEISSLNEQITTLQQKLEIARLEKARAISMAQLTRSGHVYVLSNRGSFGEGVYKIGMTRRLDPYDRVKELSNASVPFFFDVHAIISCEDAPGLENRLHQALSGKRVNRINMRREYFRTSIDEIEAALKEMGESVELTREPEAKEWNLSNLVGASDE